MIAWKVLKEVFKGHICHALHVRLRIAEERLPALGFEANVRKAGRKAKECLAVWDRQAGAFSTTDAEDSGILCRTALVGQFGQNHFADVPCVFVEQLCIAGEGKGINGLFVLRHDFLCTKSKGVVRVDDKADTFDGDAKEGVLALHVAGRPDTSV